MIVFSSCRNESLFKMLMNFNININQKDSENKNIIHNLMSFAKEDSGFTRKVFLETILFIITKKNALIDKNWSNILN